MKEKICGIYKITIVPTEKCYIGQSVDVYRRYKEHIYSMKKQRGRDDNLPIHRAMRKYGLENVYLEILERCSKEELNGREKYWISYYHSDIKRYGYNLSSGGQNSFGLRGERHSQAKLTQTQVNAIVEELYDNQKTLRQIAIEFNVSNATITNINTGKNWHNENIVYPIRKNALQSDVVAKSINDKRKVCSYETAYQIRKMYSTMCPLQEIYESFPDINPGTINAIIYRKGTCYDAIPYFDRKTKEWISLSDKPCIDYLPGRKAGE